MAKSTIKLKLLIDTHDQRVLFAEAGKDFIDFLSHILCLPVATIIRLLRAKGMEGSLANLYESMECLSDEYLQSDKIKNTLLKPVAKVSGLLALDNSPTEKNFYRCVNCASHVSDDPRAVCPNCGRTMTRGIAYVAPPEAQEATSEGGFVKGVVTYMVTDELVVKPMSAISSITLLNKFNVKDVSVLKEKCLDVGMDEAVKLLGASLRSKKVLTDVFIKI